MAKPLGGVTGLHRVTMPPSLEERLAAEEEAKRAKFCTTCGNRLQRELRKHRYDAVTGEEDHDWQLVCPLSDPTSNTPGDNKSPGYTHDIVRL